MQYCRYLVVEISSLILGCDITKTSWSFDIYLGDIKSYFSTTNISEKTG